MWSTQHNVPDPQCYCISTERTMCAGFAARGRSGQQGRELHWSAPVKLAAVQSLKSHPNQHTKRTKRMWYRRNKCLTSQPSKSLRAKGLPAVETWNNKRAMKCWRSSTSNLHTDNCMLTVETAYTGREAGTYSDSPNWEYWVRMWQQTPPSHQDADSFWPFQLTAWCACASYIFAFWYSLPLGMDRGGASRDCRSRKLISCRQRPSDAPKMALFELASIPNPPRGVGGELLQCAIAAMRSQQVANFIRTWPYYCGGRWIVWNCRHACALCNLVGERICSWSDV